MDWATLDGFDDLIKHAKDIVQVTALAAGFVVNKELAPDKNDVPIPQPILFALLIILAFAVAQLATPAFRILWCIGACAITLVAVVGFYYIKIRYRVLKEFTVKRPFWKWWGADGAEKRYIMGGCVLRTHAKGRLATGVSLEEVLLEAGGEEHYVWTRSSRAAVIALVFSLYLLATAGSMAVLFIIAQWLT